jgi:hypothetical protein
MTKISCEECHARLGEVLAEDVSVPISTSSETADVRAHLATCPNCTRDFKIVHGAREAMTSFAPVSPPDNFRARVRAHLEHELHPEPQSAPDMEAHTVVIPAGSNEPMPVFSPPNVAAMPHVPNRRDLRDSWDRYLMFFRRPANVAWASGLALAVFSLVLFVRPERRAALEEPDAALSSRPAESQTVQSQTAGEGAALSTNTDAAKAKAGAGKPAVPAKTAKTVPAPRVPGAPAPVLPPVPGATVPFYFPYGNPPMLPLPAEEALKPAGVSPPHYQPLPRIPAASPKMPAPGAAPMTSQQNGAPRPSLPTAPPQRQRYAAGPDADERKARLDDQNSRREMSSAAGPGGPSMSSPAAASDSASAPRVFSAPVEKPAPLAAKSTARTMRESGGTMESSASADRIAKRDKDEDRSTPTSRFFDARITPPRDVSWGQVSVVLTGGASFSDGGRSRVLWRGTATAGEAIEFGFSVSAPRGSYSARLELQEVRNGDVQVVASKQLPLSLR